MRRMQAVVLSLGWIILVWLSRGWVLSHAPFLTEFDCGWVLGTLALLGWSLILDLVTEQPRRPRKKS